MEEEGAADRRLGRIGADIEASTKDSGQGEQEVRNGS